MNTRRLQQIIFLGLAMSMWGHAGAAAENIQLKESMNNAYIAAHHTHRYDGEAVSIDPTDKTKPAIELKYEKEVEIHADSSIRLNGHIGIRTDHSDILLHAGSDTAITAVSGDTDDAYGMYNAVGHIDVTGNNNVITASSTGKSRGIGISSGGIGDTDNWAAEISLQAQGENRIAADTIGIEFGMGSTITLSGSHNIVQAGQTGLYSWWGGWRGDESVLVVNGGNSDIMAGNDGGDAFGVQFERAHLVLDGTSPRLVLSAASKTGSATGIYLLDSTMTSRLSDVAIAASTDTAADAVGIRTDKGSRDKAVAVTAKGMTILSRAGAQGRAMGIESAAGVAAVQADTLYIQTMTSGEESLGIGLEATTGNIAVQAGTVQIQNESSYAGRAIGIHAEKTNDSSGTVSVQAQTIAVQTADSSGTAIQAAAGGVVQLEARERDDYGIRLEGAVAGRGSASIRLESQGGTVISSRAAMLGTDGEIYHNAIFADGQAAVSIAAERGRNVIQSMGTARQRTVWAAGGGTIAVRGTTSIQPGDVQAEAIAAGDETAAAGTVRSRVDIAYGDGSAVAGQITAMAGGDVTLASLSGAESVQIDGNVAATRGGTATLRLDGYSTWTGRADTHGAAADKGVIQLVLGDNAVWHVQGQSRLSSLQGSGTVDMTSHTGKHNESYTLHVDRLEGNHAFIMNLNRNDHAHSDMLYIDDSTSAGTQTVQFGTITGMEDMTDGKTIRFATVNARPEMLTFDSSEYPTLRRIRIRDKGVMDAAFSIGYEAFSAGSSDNIGYNGAEASADKPGEAYVESVYSEGTNWFVRREMQDDVLSDAGKTIIAMSRINYSNAIYMDRLNKRMGEARYIDGDEGLWVRMRHDRIGKSDAFRSMNTMMELGYDKRVDDREDGEHRQGVAIDYMRGTADYKNVAGEGDVRRGGIWFYDTWLGNKGHYTDYVLKFGRLSNDFELYARITGEKITGDYSNFVYSASAEYGRKKDLGNNWYIEPQAQIQYAHVTDADYTTSQDTQVQLDAIDSLIGRVGFRLGKDMGENNTFYVKADMLHEFLGDQAISAFDATGCLDTTYENEGTWYDVGLGFSHQFSKGTYMFLDVEKTFGNDNEDTYQFNVGMNWKV